MNKKFILSVVALFIVSMILGFVVHAALLDKEYAALSGMFRTREESAGFFQWMILANVLAAIGLTLIYRRGHAADKPWIGQGVRFGLLLAVAVTIPTCLTYYAVQPMPGLLVVKQIVFDTIAAVLIGITAAAVNE